jgi:peptidoglycan lytic transglycosylase
VNVATPRQKFGQQYNSRRLFTAQAAQEVASFKFPLLIVLVVCALAVLSGCASRRPVAASQPPPEPSSTPETTSESVKNSTPPSPRRSGVAAKRRRDTAIPVSAGYTEQGEASWYGLPFHGRQASNGEIYDMNKLTAAHRTLPFETMVRVTNETNGKSTVVRITDRGPFVNNRIIDLSYAAAREIESIGPGVVPVRLEVLSTGINPEAGFFTIQVGSFRERANAEKMRQRLSATYSPTFVKRYDTTSGVFYRVHVGKVSGEEAAKEFGERLWSDEGVNPMVIRLDNDFSEAGEN